MRDSLHLKQADFTGLGIVVMDALLNRPWWEEEEFARRLQLPMRPVRQILRLLETVSTLSMLQSLAACFNSLHCCHYTSPLTLM